MDPFPLLLDWLHSGRSPHTPPYTRVHTQTHTHTHTHRALTVHPKACCVPQELKGKRLLPLNAARISPSVYMCVGTFVCTWVCVCCCTVIMTVYTQDNMNKLTRLGYVGRKYFCTHHYFGFVICLGFLVVGFVRFPIEAEFYNKTVIYRMVDTCVIVHMVCRPILAHCRYVNI